MNLYPRSFLQLILLGNVLVILPLLAAIGYASVTVEQLTRRSEDILHQASRATALGYALQEELGHMERILRQYEVLRDASLLEEYGGVHQEWAQSLKDYAAIPVFAGMTERIQALRTMEAAAYGRLGARAEGLPQLKTTLATLKRNLNPLLEEAHQQMERERNAFRQQADALWYRLLIALLAAFSLSAALIWSGRRTVQRLWSRFERAVLALGQGQLDRRIRLKGPEDMQRVGRRLEWLRQRLHALESERNRVMRHASHELRTPLATLREGASLLGDGVAGALTPQQAKIAGIMQTNAVRLQKLIDGMLQMQQANHARDHMEKAPIRLDKMIEQTLATLQLAVRDRRVKISGSLAPLTVDGGNEALATLTSNLIANAVKFSPDGGTVRVTLTRDGDNAVFDVIDDGPGISAEDREHIFEPFYRGSSSKGIPGVGLGLAIAHEFALAHRGSLAVLDTECGAHFRACLPLAEKAA